MANTGQSINFLLAGVKGAESGTITTFETGTSTPKNVYTSADLSTGAATSISLDANGAVAGSTVYFGKGLYRLVIKDTDASTLYTKDGIVFGPSGTFDMSSYADLSDAVDDVGATEGDLLIHSAFNVGDSNNNESVTVPTTLRLVFHRGGSLVFAGTELVTINGPIDAGLWKIFDSASSGDVTFGGGSIDAVHPDWWGTNTTPGTTDMYDEIASAIASVSPNNKIEFNPVVYASETQIVATKAIYMVGSGYPINVGSGGSVIKYTGAAAGSGAVLKVDADAGAINGFTIEGLKIDANSLAGYGVWLSGPDVGDNINYFNMQKSHVANFTDDGLRIEGSGQIAEGTIRDSFFASSSANVYGVETVTGGSNFSNWLFDKVTFDGSASYKNNVFLDGGGGDFIFNECLFAQTIAQSSNDGFAVLVTNGNVVLRNCLNESNGLLSQGNTWADERWSVIDNTPDSGAGTYSVIANLSNQGLEIKNSFFGGDIHVISGSTADHIKFENLSFASGKGIIDQDRNTIGDNSTTLKVSEGLGINDSPLAEYVWDTNEGDDALLTGLAKVHTVQLQGNITALTSPSIVEGGSEFTINFVNTGAHTVGWTNSYAFVAGSAPTITVAVTVGGAGDTEYTVADQGSDTWRYTFTAGTDPTISAADPKVGMYLNITGFVNGGNNGIFVVTNSDTNFFEITNASGVAEVKVAPSVLLCPISTLEFVFNGDIYVEKSRNLNVK